MPFRIHNVRLEYTYMPTLTLTPVQAETLDFIRDYAAKHGKSPTIVELSEALQLKSLRSVTQRLESLERKGYTRRNKFQRRSIMILDPKDPYSGADLVQIPVIASAGCDAMDVYAQDEFGEFIAVDKKLIGPHTEVAAVKAVGDSMQDAGIRNGDYVIVEVTEQAEDGDRVVAIIGNMAVIKRYKKVDAVVYLHPENSSGEYHPIIVAQEDSKIFGKVLSIIPGSEWIDDVKIEYYPGYEKLR